MGFLIVIVLLIFLSNKISQVSSSIVDKIYELKDRRVQVTTEAIEGIKFIKMYGW